MPARAVFESGRTQSIVLGLSLLATLVAGAALRVWGIDYGIPHPVARPDEEIVVGKAFSMVGERDLNPYFFEYPTLSIYATALAMEAYYHVGTLTGRYDRRFDFLFDAVVLRPGLNQRIARHLSLVLALGTILATFALGREHSERNTAGLVAAFLMSVSFVHVVFSRFATVDVAMTLCTTASLWFSLRAARNQSYRAYLVAGGLAGLAASAKYNAGIVGLALVPAALFPHAGSGRTSRFVKLLLGAAASLVAFAATSPYAMLHWQQVQEGLSKHSHFYTSGPDPLGLWVHLGTTFPVGLGWPLYVVSALGLALALRRRKPGDWVLVVFFVCFFAMIAGVRVVYPRYVLPLVPVMAVFAADVVSRYLRSRFLLGLAVAVLALPNLLASVRFDRLASREDTRIQATDWIASKVPRREAILVCKGYGAPHINEDRRRPPAFEPRERACTRESILASEARYVVTHEHPVLTKYSSLPPNAKSLLENRAHLAARFDPFRKRSGAVPLFFYSDAFYLPLAGFEAVERGGPVVTIWEREVR